MSAAAPVNTRHALETRLIEKAWKDSQFRQDVVRDPKGMLEKLVGRKLPDELKIFIHEEDSSTLHFSVPPTPANMSELSDEELEKVAGGTDIIGTIAVAIITTGLITGASATATKQAGGW